ncbi:MAG: Hsp33 family molecular chaperone HslO [Dokdonella sp.]
MTTNDDKVYPFHLQNAGVRGQVVHLDSSWQEILAHSSYPKRVQQLLGESLAASALFASALKFEGRLSIQLRHAGSLNLLFAECTNDGALRGIARCEEGSTDEHVDLSSADARLALTIENHQTDSRYQGLVAVESATLAGAFETYFERSEQLPSRILLFERDGRCAGMMVQKIADADTPNDPDAWNRVSHLLATLSEPELLDVPVETLLLRLFHAEGVVLQPGRSLRFECSCSHDRVLGMLRSLGREQALEALGESREMEITCEFCNRSYAIDPVDLTGLFSEAPLAPGSAIS